MSAKPSSIRWAESEIARRQSEIEDLRAYIRVEKMKAGAEDTTKDIPVELANGAKPHGWKKRTMLGAIAASPTGLSTQQVIIDGATSGLPDMKVENVSPQLSSYRKAGLLKLNSGIWHITADGLKYLNFQEEGGHP